MKDKLIKFKKDNKQVDEIKENKKSEVDYRKLENAKQDTPYDVDSVSKIQEVEEDITFDESTILKDKTININGIFKLIAVCLVILIIFIIVTSLLNNSVGTLSGITVNSEPIIYVGEKATISANAQGSGNLRNTYFYFKTDSEIAKFSKTEGIKGKTAKNTIEATKTGKVLVTIYASLQGARSDLIEKEIIVCNKLETALKDKTVTLDLSKIQNLNLNLGEDKACYEGLEISIMDDSIASVDSDLKVNPKKIGETNITLNLNKERLVVKLKVIDPKERIPVEKIEPIDSPIVMTVGSTARLKVAFTPANTTNKNIIWKAESGISVDKNGVIKALRSGLWTVTAITESGGHEASFSIIVKSK